MKLKVISLIRKQEESLAELEREYVKRMSRWLSCELIEIKREKIGQQQEKAELSKREWEKIEKHLRPGVLLVTLDRQGKQFDSPGLARWLEKQMQSGSSEIIFLIGGPLGLHEKISKFSHFQMSFSNLTFPHKIARILVLEALYRSLSIINGMPYHK